MKMDIGVAGPNRFSSSRGRRAVTGAVAAIESRKHSSASDSKARAVGTPQLVHERPLAAVRHGLQPHLRSDPKLDVQPASTRSPSALLLSSLMASAGWISIRSLVYSIPSDGSLPGLAGALKWRADLFSAGLGVQVNTFHGVDRLQTRWRVFCG
jgi:hypothetical protein